MDQAKQGNTVKVHYTGKLADGKVFDTSEGKEPLEFKLGEKQVIPGFEEMVVGMQPGESRSGKIPFDKAYGPRKPELVMTVGRDRLPENVEPKVGDMFKGQRNDGQSVVFTVVDLAPETITLDANHPLAGKDLVFDVTLVEVA